MLIEGLYSIVTFNAGEQEIQTTVKLNASHEVFKGHFPGNPVMPGVCMIQMIKELTEKHINKELFLTIASNVKFMAIINPEKNDTIQLKLTLTEDDDIIKVKNITSFDDTIALKLSATFKIIE